MGKKLLYEHVTYYEDCIIKYIIHQYAKSWEHHLKIGYLYIFRASSNSHTESYINKLKSQIYYTTTIFKYSILSPKNKELMANDLVTFMKNQNIQLQDIIQIILKEYIQN